ncbi:MAG: hypothetical protein E7231_18750 [Cellulosilyticum sp.]|nr:hypothetical protein [Cellulosilyticum sp.]
MFQKSSSLKNNLKNPLNSIKVIGLLGISSMFFTNCVVAHDLNTVTKISTPSSINYAPEREVPTGYVKGDYKTVALPYYATKKVVSPMTNELSLQEAAEIAAQELYRLYNVKLTNQTFQMCYYPKTNDKPSSWSISINVTPEYYFDLTLDPSTGELLSLMSQGSPETNKLSDSEDSKIITNGMAIAKKGIANPDDACAKVKTLVTQKGFISEPIETIVYKDSTYSTACAVATPYSHITHRFQVTTTSKTTYSILTSQDLTIITTFFKN